MKLDLLTNSTVVDNAIRFITEYSKKEKLKLTDSDKEKSKKPDCGDKEVTIRSNERQKTTYKVF